VSLCGFRFAANTNKFANWIVLAQFCHSAGTIGITLFQLTAVSGEEFMMVVFESNVSGGTFQQRILFMSLFHVLNDS
jgi:hypothetical protein